MEQQPQDRTKRVHCLEVTEDKDGRTYITLEDEEDFRVRINTSMWTDNHLPVPATGEISISADMFKSLFDDLHTKTRNELSRKILDGFTTIMQQKHVFGEDPELLNIRPDWLRSSIPGCILEYNLGTLFKVWDNGDQLRLPDGKSFILTISYHPIKGAHKYLAWNPQDGIFDGSGIPVWKNRIFYLRNFPVILQPGNRPPLKNMRELLTKTGLISI
jgi:hypothetical protein